MVEEIKPSDPFSLKERKLYLMWRSRRSAQFPPRNKREMANDREALAVNIRRSRLFFMAGGVQVKANLVPKSGLPRSE